MPGIPQVCLGVGFCTCSWFYMRQKTELLTVPWWLYCWCMLQGEAGWKHWSRNVLSEKNMKRFINICPRFLWHPYRGIWKKAVSGHTLLWCFYRHLRTCYSRVSLAHLIFSPFFLCGECVHGEVQQGRQYIKTWIRENTLYFSTTGRSKQPRTSTKSLAFSSFAIFAGGMKA